MRNWVEVVGEGVSTLFPIWVALGCLMGLVKPSSFVWVTPKLTMLGITFTMLGMGMTLTFDDLKGALAMPKELFAGFFLQYSVSYFFYGLNVMFVMQFVSLFLYVRLVLMIIGLMKSFRLYVENDICIGGLALGHVRCTLKLWCRNCYKDC